MSEGSTVQLTLPPKTLGEAEAVIRHLKCPVPDRALLTAIGSAEGDRFKQSLEKAAKGSEDDMAYVRGVTQSVSSANRDRISQLGITVPPTDVLIHLGARPGANFAGVVYAALNHTDEGRRKEARQCASGMIVQAMSDLGVVASQPGAQPSGQRRPAPPSSSGSTPSRTNGSDDERSTGLTSGADFDTQPEREGADRWLSTHVYGGKAALCFQADEVKGSKTRTIRVEAATCTGTKTYDWKSKVAIQLSVKEMPLLLGVFLGYLKIYEVSGHNGKGFKIEDQGGKFFMSVNAKDNGSKPVPIPAGDSYPIIALFLRQMQANDPHLSVETILRIVHRICAIAAAAQQGRAPAPSSGGSA